MCPQFECRNILDESHSLWQNKASSKDRAYTSIVGPNWTLYAGRKHLPCSNICITQQWVDQLDPAHVSITDDAKYSHYCNVKQRQPATWSALMPVMLKAIDNDEAQWYMPGFHGIDGRH